MTTPSATKKLSDQDKAKIVERAQRELPDLDKRFEKAVVNLERISEGLRPKA